MTTDMPAPERNQMLTWLRSKLIRQRSTEVRETAEALTRHIGRMLDDWAEIGQGDQRNRELWTPLHEKADALRAALGQPV